MMQTSEWSGEIELRWYLQSVEPQRRLGFILRDHEGNVISSGFGRLAKVLEPAYAEIIGCLQAVQRAADLDIQIQNIILESDAAVVINVVLPMEMDRSSASGLLWELKDLSCNFAFKKVAHKPRFCNSVAHSLAAHGAGLNLDMVSVRDCIPPCTQVLVADYCRFFC
jgi:ribonuclease HI